MVHVLVEESYVGNNRTELILDGMNFVLKKKRIPVKTYTSIDALPEGVRVVVLLCASLKWTMDTIAELNKRSIHPLLFGFQYIDTMYQYSCITPTYTKSMYRLVRHILSARAGKTAFVGFNEDSLPDRLKLAGVRYATNEFGVECVVFGSHGDVEKCISDFAAAAKGIDHVVCCVDSVAMILKNVYPEILRGKTICSCSGTRVSEFAGEPIPTTKINYFKAGMQVAELYQFLNKCYETVSTTMTLEMDVDLGGGKTLETDVVQPSEIIYSEKAVDFYGDKRVSEVENLDSMLIRCDEMDLNILREITNGCPYEQIAEKYYMAPNTVKYRLHAMLVNGGFLNRKELLAAIEKYNLVF